MLSMYLGKKIGAILLMAGEGLRMGSDLPKQFLLLGDRPVYSHALDALISSALFDEIVLVCHPQWLHLMKQRAITGGKTRQESSYLGLKGFRNRPDIVLIHDAVRPFVTEEILKKNVEGAIRFGAIDTCIPSVDTLVYAPDQTMIQSIPNRSHYLRGQTPQTFRMDWILEAHEKALEAGIENATDDCRLVLQLGKPVHIVLGSENNLKITSESDLIMAEHFYSAHLIFSFKNDKIPSLLNEGK